MSMYAITNGPEGVVQASTPIFQAMGIPITGPRATVQSSSEWSGIPDSSLGTEEPNIEQAPCGQPKAEVGRAGQVAKNTPIATLDIPRDIPCDRCGKVGWPCFPRTKGGQVLSACAACYGLKMSCKTSGSAATSRKEVEQLEAIDAVKEETEVPGQERTAGEAEDKPGRT